MADKQKPAPTDIASESVAGEEDPGAALETLIAEQGTSTPASPGRDTPPEGTPLESPMPRSPTLENEEPELANEEDIGQDDDAQAVKGAGHRAKPV